MNRKSLIALLLSIGIVLGSTSAPAQQNISNATIRVIILKNFPPQFVSTADGPSGLAVELIREVAQRASLNIEFVTLNSWKEVYAPLKNGTVDVISNIGISEARNKILEFTDPYEVFDIKIFVRKENNNIKTLEDVKGKLLGVQATNVLTKRLVNSGDYQIRQYASFQLALLGLLSGEVDAVPAPTEPFLLIAREAHLDGRIKFVGTSLLEVKRAIALPKGRTELRDRLNKSLREFKQTDEYQNLLTKWYGSATPYWTTTRLVILMGIIFAASILVMGIWSYYSIVRLNRCIHESEDQKKLIIQTVPDMIWLKNTEGIYQACNTIFEHLCGASEAKIIGKTDFDLFDHDTANVSLKMDKLAIEANSLTYEEEFTFADDGHKEVMLITKTLMKSVDGTVHGILAIGRDITEMKTALQDRDRLLNDSVERSKQLEENEKRYRNLFENAEISIWNKDFSKVYQKLEQLRLEGVIDLKKYLKENPVTTGNMAASIRVIHVNEMTLKLFGADNAKELIEQIDKTFGANAFDVLIEELCAIWNKLKVFRFEAAFRTLDGKNIQAIISFQIPQTVDGFNSIPVSIIDITERKEIEKSLRRAQKMDAIGQMAGGIAHDFNNTLGIIIGNLSFLKRQIGQDKNALKRVEMAGKAVQRAVDLTRQLLGFSRHQVQQVQATDINRVIQGMDRLIARSVTPEVEVEHYFAADLWQAEINSADLEDALLNLVLNARDTMPEGGQLTIETSNKVLDITYAEKNPAVVPGNYVELVINDTGKGISKEDLDRIFDPFFTTKPRGKGTGLGLSMVFGFIQRSKGHIKVYSEPGIGTTFRCYLPRASSNSKTQQVSIADEHKLPQGHETVLMVDDESDLLTLAQQYLEDLGYTAVTATSGLQAMEILAKRQDIDLLFSDVVMPGGMNGYELAEEAAVLHPALKVLLTSGYTSKSLYRNGQARYKANLLNKPYNQHEIASRVRQVLDKPLD